MFTNFLANTARQSARNPPSSGVIPVVLSGLQLLLSLLKSLFLQAGAANGLATFLAVAVYLLESLLSLALAALVTANAWHASASGVAAVRAGVLLLVATSLLATFAAGVQLRARSRPPSAPSLLSHARGELWKALAFVVGSVALCVAFAREGEASAHRVKQASPLVLRLLFGVTLLAAIVVIALSIALPKRPLVRASAAALMFVVGTIFAVTATSAAWFEGSHFARSNGSSAPLTFYFLFRFHVQFAIFCAAAAVALVALTAVEAADSVPRTGLQPQHARVLEAAALAVTGPLIVLAISEQAAKDARQIIFIALAQTAMVVFPLLVAHAVTLCRGHYAIEQIADEGGWSS